MPLSWSRGVDGGVVVVVVVCIGVLVVNADRLHRQPITWSKATSSQLVAKFTILWWSGGRGQRRTAHNLVRTTRTTRTQEGSLSV